MKKKTQREKLEDGLVDLLWVLSAEIRYLKENDCENSGYNWHEEFKENLNRFTTELKNSRP